MNREKYITNKIADLIRTINRFGVPMNDSKQKATAMIIIAKAIGSATALAK